MDCDLRKVGFSTCLVSVEAEGFVTCSSFQVRVNLNSMNRPGKDVKGPRNILAANNSDTCLIEND